MMLFSHSGLGVGGHLEKENVGCAGFRGAIAFGAALDQEPREGGDI